MPARKTVTLYTVQSQCWTYNDEWYDPPLDDLRFDDDYGDALPFDEYEPPQPMRTFLTREAAERYQTELERRERRTLNPLHYSEGTNLDDFSSLTPAEFTHVLQQAGLDPPALRRGQLEPRFWEWLYQGLETWGEEDRDAVWQACDKIRFFKVVPVKVEVQAHASGGREVV